MNKQRNRKGLGFTENQNCLEEGKEMSHSRQSVTSSPGAQEPATIHFAGLCQYLYPPGTRIQEGDRSVSRDADPDAHSDAGGAGLISPQ